MNSNVECIIADKGFICQYIKLIRENSHQTINSNVTVFMLIDLATEKSNKVEFGLYIST